MDKHKQARSDKVNIYELAHKCKEWANSYNAVIISWCRGCPIEHKDELFHSEVYFAHNYDENIDSTFELFSAESELEAVFKACQWILDSKEVTND